MRAFLIDAPKSNSLRALNYSPEVERIRRSGSSTASRLEEVVKTFGPAHGTVFTRIDCAPEYGVELLSQSDMFSVEPRGRVIRRDSMPVPDRHLVERGQILMAGAGTLGETELYGRSVLADARLAGKYVGPDCMTLVLEDPENDFSLFAYAWLASPTGVRAVRSTSYGTKLLRFRRELLQSLPLPRPDKEIVRRVAALVRQSIAEREQWLKDVQQARAAFDGEIETAGIQGAADKQLKVKLWRGPLLSLSARNYFARHGDTLEKLSKFWSCSLSDYMDEREPVGHGSRMVRTPCLRPHGVDFLSQRDVFLATPIPQRVVIPGNADWALARRGQILMAADGQVTAGSLFGRVELADAGFVGLAVTEHILRLNPQPGLAEALAAFLSTDIGQSLVRSTAVGTSVPKVRTDLLLSLPMPPPHTKVAQAAQEAMTRAVQRRIAAVCAEREAIRIVEEEVLPQWLG
jgi:hypothetical protein